MSKVLMIGLDGATFALLKPFMEDGTMPYLKEFVSGGVYGDLMSTLNPLTPPAWISMITGRSPEVHGIYDFLRPEISDGKAFLKVNDSRDIRCETVWSMVSRQGKRATTMNFYGMSPPVPIDGYLISGFIPWRHLRSATYPESLFETIKTKPGFDYKQLGMDIGEEKKCIQGIEDGEFEPWITLQSERDAAWTELLCHLMETDPTDLTAVVFDGTDKLQHLFWRYLDPILYDPNSGEWDAHIREMCLNYYRQLDVAIKRLVTLSGPETNVIMTSDHGFGSTTEVVYINEWLAQNGYLKWADMASTDENFKLTADRIKDHTLMIDWDQTVAYSLTPSSNAIHVKMDMDGTGHGIRPQDYDAFCDRLKQEMLDYRNPADGGQIFTGAEFNHEKRNGQPFLEHSPDLTIRLRDFGFVSIVRSGEVVRPRLKPDGTHRPNGIFIGRGPDIQATGQVAPLSILDVTPCMLYLLGLPIPKDMEGNVPTDVISAESLMARPIQSGDVTQADAGKKDNAEVSEEEKEALMAQLKLLGYMD
jgi:predicted AlkP superfamily phosphohydrolase/phosphomutase